VLNDRQTAIGIRAAYKEWVGCGRRSWCPYALFG
jgi:hypothetical protein